MGNQPEDRAAGPPRNKAELLARIHRSRSALEATLDSLSQEQLVTAGPSGWSIKDHLAHLAVWELGIAELLRRRPRFAAMGVEQAAAREASEDEINDLIYHQHKDLSLSQVMDKFQSVHQGLLEALEALEDDDLFKPYASFVVEGGQGAGDAVINWVIGNTYPHYDEHLGYINTLLQEIGE